MASSGTMACSLHLRATVFILYFALPFGPDLVMKTRLLMNLYGLILTRNFGKLKLKFWNTTVILFETRRDRTQLSWLSFLLLLLWWLCCFLSLLWSLSFYFFMNHYSYHLLNRLSWLFSFSDNHYSYLHYNYSHWRLYYWFKGCMN